MNLLDLQRSPSAFRSALLIDTDSGPRPFADIMDPWQAADFQALDTGWQNAAGQSPEGEVRQRPGSNGHAVIRNHSIWR